MPKSWSKGLTKENNVSIKKRSETMKARGLDNFIRWRDEMKRSGKIKSVYPSLKKNGDLAELVGVILGDGHIRRYPRTDELSIFSNSNNNGFIKRYSDLVEKVFDRKPAITKHSGANCIRIRIYQNHIQDRLDIPYSPRGELNIKVPKWISSKKTYVIRYLRGLYEAEGSFCQHLPTSTFKFLFANKNQSMLDNVFNLMIRLEFHPHMSKNNYCVQLSRKEEVFKAIKLLNFREY